ncbi:MAG TPA: Fis family transcriptional regulator, partial [Candidatus Riflebacteria bacterium]|nr:Fis family transcriptional regulator [Candidatus Riflebacteria bacterium]
FREDLWFRLNVFPIELPPLRQRKEDILSLVQYFMVRKSRELNLPVNQSLAPGTLDRLLQYDWPGNVRELQNVIERGLIICSGQPMEIPASYFPGRVVTVLSPEASMDTLENVVRAHLCKALAMTRGRIEGPGGAAEILAINPSTLRGKLRKYKIPFGHKM